MDKEKKQRTIIQNNSMHKFFELFEKEAYREGVTYTEFIRKRPQLELPWTKEKVKEVWRDICFLLYGHRHTSKLKTDQVKIVYDVFNKAVGETINVHIPFPSNEPPLLEEI